VAGVYRADFGRAEIHDLGEYGMNDLSVTLWLIWCDMWWPL